MIKSVIAFLSIIILMGHSPADWGFFVHRKINRYAVFILPEEMLSFYKKHIEYLTEHAVDPDKRRYALKTEATRHYIDIDAWDTLPFNNIPRDFEEAVFNYGTFIWLNSKKDTLTNELSELEHWPNEEVRRSIMDDRYSNEIKLQTHLLGVKFLDNKLSTIVFKNKLAENGVLPYFLEEFYDVLVRSFETRNEKAILKISADIGHYIGDAHVPLHTTLNYNGELTNQLGIHAFWESRLPELFAEEEYDFVVGKAEYIPDIRSYIWTTIKESHACLEEVLQNEMNLRDQFSPDQQMCFDERNEIITYTQCREFSKAYHDSLNGMVEDRMQKSILAIGSVWYSAWIDAGQPVLDDLSEVAHKDKTGLKTFKNYNEIHHQ